MKKPEPLAILGKSGAGKSTLLGLLGGLDSADAGQIIVNGKDIVPMKESALAKYQGRKYWDCLSAVSSYENFHCS